MSAEPLDLRTMAARLMVIEGVEAVLLGGSRARGDHLPGSDFDLGVYYRPSLDVAGLGRLARELAGPAAEVTEPGGWGPWVDGGGWLDVGGVRVDWIYRDVDRVQQAWTDAQAGRFSFHRQPGHQLGVPDFAYVGEVALGDVLADRTGEVTALQRAAVIYPAALTTAFVAGLWEPAFELAGAQKATSRGDTVYVAGVIAHALLLCAHGITLAELAGGTGEPVDERAATQRSAAWSPWRGYAAQHLWSAWSARSPRRTSPRAVSPPSPRWEPDPNSCPPPCTAASSSSTTCERPAPPAPPEPSQPGSVVELAAGRRPDRHPALPLRPSH